MSLQSKQIEFHNHVIDLKRLIQRILADQIDISYATVNMTIHGERNNPKTIEKIFKSIKICFPMAIVAEIKKAA